MRLLLRVLRAARGLVPAGAGAGAGVSLGGKQPWRPLSAAPDLTELFAAPGLPRLLEARAGNAELAARIQRLRAKEQELRETQELVRSGGTAPLLPTAGRPRPLTSELEVTSTCL